MMVFVDPAVPNKPAALVTRDREREHDTRFLTFVAEAPPASVFTVPTECNQPPPPPSAGGNHPMPRAHRY